MPTSPLARPPSPPFPGGRDAPKPSSDTPMSACSPSPPLPAATLACLRVLETLGRRRPESQAEDVSVASSHDSLDFSAFLSFSEIHQLLLDAEALDTPAKYAHMFHAVCVLADRRLEALQRRVGASNPLSGVKKKRRLTVEGALKREDGERDDREGERNAKTGDAEAAEKSLFEEEEGLGSEEAPDRLETGEEEGAPQHRKTGGREAQQSPGREKAAGQETPGEALESETASDDEACESAGSAFQPHQRQRQEMAAHVAGLLLGTLESLRRPPALGAEEFLETVTHVLSRVLYVHQPVASAPDGDASKTCAASVARSFPSFSSAAECRQAWRRGVIRRFDTIDQLLTQSSSVFSSPCAASGTREEPAQAPRVSGKERCRRAMRLVRQWAAFLLELEKLRRQTVDRVRSTSEEAQGLTHMLFSPAESGCDAQEKRKKSEIIVAGFDDDNGEETAAKEERRLELRIAATAQLLRLPLLPPFVFPTDASVTEARAKFDRCLARWREDRARRKQQEEEALKKASAAASIVTYVTERMREQEEASAALASALPGSSQALAALVRQRSISHAFYLLGLNPLTATVQMVEAVKKKWRVLLHPDKFHSIHPHLLHQATEAFKAFQLAVDEAIRTLNQRRVDPSWAQPPPPPDPSASPVPPGMSPFSNGSSKSSPTPSPSATSPAGAAAPATASSPCPLPTRQYFPEFSIEVAPRRKSLGAFFLYVSAAGAGADPAFSEITEIRVYVHRPTMGGPPGNLTPPAEALSAVITRKVSLVSSRQREDDRAVEEKIEVVDAVQPLSLGEERRYWVGVQVEGKKKDFSLIRWSPVLLRLALPPSVDAPESEDASARFPLGSALGGKKDEAGQATAEARVLTAFLTSFSEAAFLDARTRGKVDELLASLKRLVRHISKKKTKKGADGGSDFPGTALSPELLTEYLATAKEARETLHLCIEKGKVWANRNS
uniref:DnaJ domain-containing protein n=1 Tax=Neospora caninum (strain Liverpool) TaxID=572307 RepID=A0A0F7UJB6_NEOCL|nr:TPA: hypothetical protein BN1204_048560 [Neospora caninum Liverpool]